MPRIPDKLGGCPRCMGLSLGLSIVAWAVAALSLAADAPPALTLSLGMPEAALSALFVAHIAAFAVRAIRAPEPCAACGGAREPSERQIRRRQLLGILGGAVAAGIALSLTNIPVIRQVLAQDKLPCEDVGGPIFMTRTACVTETETEEQLKARLLEEAKTWIADNEGRFENIARTECADDACKIQTQRCIAVHYTVSAHVNCFATRDCASGRACQGVVTMGVRCRCVNAECATARLNPPVEISVEVCTERPNPTKEEFRAACKTASQQVEALLQNAAERTCDQQSCPPKNQRRPACKVGKVEKTQIKCERVKGRQNCCRCTGAISAVQCKCE